MPNLVNCSSYHIIESKFCKSNTYITHNKGLHQLQFRVLTEIDMVIIISKTQLIKTKGIMRLA